MQTIEITVYTASELKKQFPRAFARALENWRNDNTEIFRQDEIVESFKSVFKHTSGICLRNWSIGANNRGNGCAVEFLQDEAGELTGARARAWLENNLLNALRVPWSGPKRWKLAQYGAPYRAGMIKPCPFTGYCADEDFLDSLKKDIASGCDLKCAFESLANVAAKLIESELEDQNSAEYFLEHADANGYQFTDGGERF